MTSATRDLELVLWAACLHDHDLLERARHVAENGFAAMTTFVTDAPPVTDPDALRRLRREIEARGTRINCVDVYLGWYPGYDPASAGGEASALLRATEDEILGVAEALGAEHVSIAAPFAGDDAPFELVVEALRGFTARAAARGIRPHLEISNGSKVPDVATAVRLLDAVDAAELGIVLDTYNLMRAGGSPSDVEALPLERIFQIQLVDGYAEPVGDRFHDSLHFRQLPGEGELPLVDILRRLLAKGPLPPIGPEVFNDDLAALPLPDAARRSAEVTRQFLSALVGPDRGGPDAAPAP